MTRSSRMSRFQTDRIGNAVVSNDVATDSRDSPRSLPPTSLLRRRRRTLRSRRGSLPAPARDNPRIPTVQSETRRRTNPRAGANDLLAEQTNPFPGTRSRRQALRELPATASKTTGSMVQGAGALPWERAKVHSTAAGDAKRSTRGTSSSTSRKARH